MNALLIGPDEDGLGPALESAGVSVTHVDGAANRPALESAGVIDADVFVLTDASQATAIPVAKELNDDLFVVVYAHDSLPEFALAQADFILDPRLLAPDTVASEIADRT